jgi:hypothetical protein
VVISDWQPRSGGVARTEAVTIAWLRIQGALFLGIVAQYRLAYKSDPDLPEGTLDLPRLRSSDARGD